MAARGFRGLWLRGLAAVAACLLAIASTGALVVNAVVVPAGGGSSVSLMDSQGKDNTDSTDGKDGKGGKVPPPPTLAPRPTATWTTPVPKAPKPTPRPKPAALPRPAPRVAPQPHPAPQLPPPTRAAAVPTARVVVDTSDPAPFSSQVVAATEAARVLPVESLGPLSGISFGSGLFIWPLLLAVDILALAVIARMALRRRLASPED
jgi:hypothetical protein